MGYSVRAGLFYLYFLVCECDRLRCLACEYCRASCVGCLSGSGGDVAIGCLVAIWFGDLVSGAFGRLALLFIWF